MDLNSQKVQATVLSSQITLPSLCGFRALSLDGFRLEPLKDEMPSESLQGALYSWSRRYGGLSQLSRFLCWLSQAPSQSVK